MIEFEKTTIQKGLERFLPEVSDTDSQEIIFNAIGYALSEYNFGTRDDDVNLYRKIDTNLKNNISIQENHINLGKSVFEQLEKRMKSYQMPLNPEKTYITQQQRREAKTIGRILGEHHDNK